MWVRGGHEGGSGRPNGVGGEGGQALGGKEAGRSALGGDQVGRDLRRARRRAERRELVYFDDTAAAEVDALCLHVALAFCMMDQVLKTVSVHQRWLYKKAMFLLRALVDF